MNFIPRRKQGDPEFAKDRQTVAPDRSREANILGSQLPALRQDCAASGYIFASEATISAFLDTSRDVHITILKLAILLHKNRIGALRHRGTGKNAIGPPAFGRTAERVSRSYSSGYWQIGVTIRIQIVKKDSKPIDSRVVMGRHGTPRDDIFRQNSASSLSQGNGFGSDDNF
jgi:hypothetical protein